MARESSQDTWSSGFRKLIFATLPPRSARAYIGDLSHWRTHKGPEWVANRTKVIWNVANLLRAGQSHLITGLLLDARIKCIKGLPSGVEGELVRRYAEIQSPSLLRRAAVPLRAYTAVRLKNASKSQILKARDSITQTGKPSGIIWLGTSSDRDLGKQGHLSMRYIPKNWTFELDSLVRLSGTSRYPSLLKIPGRSLQGTPFLSLTSSLLTKGRVPRVLLEAFPTRFALQREAERIQEKQGDASFGRITLIQEGGAKGRVVTSPNAWVQFYCKPYHDYLANIVRSIEAGDQTDLYGLSCVFDQLRGIYVALSRAQHGSYLAGVDLSSATDRFPLDFQQEVLKSLGLSAFSEALGELRGPYLAPTKGLWCYGRGQPMGLMGSFPLFHLTHFIHLSGLAEHAGLPPGQPWFLVTGDDVLFFDDELHRRYLHSMEEMEVPISWHKSFEGNLVEFLGFVITKSRGTWTAFRPYKFDHSRGLTTALNVLHAVGSNVREWTTNWADRYAEYQRLIPNLDLALSPLIPEAPLIRKDDGLPGSRYIGNLINQAFYSDSDDILSPDLYEIWLEERALLLKEEVQATGFEERLNTRQVDSFDPRLYIQSERDRKQFWSGLMGVKGIS